MYTISAPELEGPPRSENQQQEVSDEESPSETQPMLKEVSIADGPVVTTFAPPPQVNGEREESDQSEKESEKADDSDSDEVCTEFAI